MIYIYDQNFVMKSLPPGSRIVDNRLVITEEEIKADKLIPSDLRSARLVQSVANTLSPFIKVTIDYRSQNPADLCQIWMSKLRW